ncbi:MAG: IS1595 family transposase [Acidobacteriia bacterium]|nr:IS1595 family transposase [Terriglobia bacterium]
MNLAKLAEHFGDDEKARAFLEKMRWPDGAVCPHCGVIRVAYRLEPKPNGKTHVRKGVWKCSACREQFTVTVGTIFEDSHIPLHKWLLAIHLLCASKKGMSAHQLHRMLGVTYKSAWFMAHRIRYAMKQEPLSSKLQGTVEVDETYVGGKVKGRGCYLARENKTPIVSLVERNGRARSFHFEHVTAANLRPVLREQIHESADLMTDDSGLYRGMRKGFASHHTVKHANGEYVRRREGKVIHTNTVEGFFSILKRGIFGVYHHVGRQHLHRYLTEFDFRYNSRETTDGERALLAIESVAGKRLMYKDSCVKA